MRRCARQSSVFPTSKGASMRHSGKHARIAPPIARSFDKTHFNKAPWEVSGFYSSSSHLSGV
eukprot:2704084-Pleurochrysis_carterae.AAC.2